APVESATESPWGQAYSLLSDVASFPRKALTDGFFFRGLKVSEDELIDAMNVADDALCRDLGSRGIKERCKTELELLSRIERAPITARERCGYIQRILAGEPVATVAVAIARAEFK